LAALSTRLDLAGVTSFVRTLGFVPAAYHRLLHLFHCTGVNLGELTNLWARLVLKVFTPLKAGNYLVCLADGIKAPKEGKKMPAVKSLHQSADSNSKPPFIMGHSFQAVSLLVSGPGGYIGAVPLVARIHEGLVWSNRDQRTLLDRMVALLFSVTDLWERKVILVADAYYASRKVIRPLLDKGHHLVTRARMNTVAYLPVEPTDKRRRGRPRIYGDKIRLKDLTTEDSLMHTALSPIPGEAHVKIRYACFDLMWRPVGQLVRFVIVGHPQRGTIILMSTDTDMDPLTVIALYSYRFKIETGFRQAIHVLGVYAYHFWMEAMTPIKRRSGNQHLHMKSENYRRLVRRKMNAYHLHVQLGCIAQGLLLHLAINHGSVVWKHFRSWLRTMNPSMPPSELVVASSLRDT
ncbi:MAG: transposase, partial [bacterium]